MSLKSFAEYHRNVVLPICELEARVGANSTLRFTAACRLDMSSKPSLDKTKELEALAMYGTNELQAFALYEHRGRL